MIKYSRFCILFLILFTHCSQDPSKIIRINDIKVSYWLHGKRHALSLTFDDTCPTHRKIGDILREYGLFGSFFPNPGVIWSENINTYKYLKKAGHEVGNHSQNHLYFTKIDSITIVNEICKADSRLVADLDIHPVSFVHPFNATTPKVDSIVFQYYLFSRIASPYGIDNRIIYDLGKYGRTVEFIKENIMDKTRQDIWFITAGHRIGTSEWDNSEEFLRELISTVSKTDGVWVDKLSTIGAYDYLRREIKINSKFTPNGIICSITNYDENKYKDFKTLPVTVEIPLNKKYVDFIDVNNKALEIQKIYKTIYVTFDLKKHQNFELKIK